MSIVVIDTEELRSLIKSEVAEGLRVALAERPAVPACEWLDAKQAAELVGVQPAYLRRLAVPVHGSRRKPRYRRREVEQFIESRR